MMPLYGHFPIVYDQEKTFELLQDHHDILSEDFDLLPQFMQIMLRFGAPKPSVVA